MQSLVMRILVTGANGFIGNHLVLKLTTLGCYEVWCLVRRAPLKPVLRVKYFIVDDLSIQEPLHLALTGVDVIIHTAARVHIFNKSKKSAIAEYRSINVDGTVRLAEQAAALGVRRFIFLSSIGVNGIKTENGRLFTELDEPNPHSEYAISKQEAENGLMHISKNTDLEVVIIRPPLVYGLMAPGNFDKLVSVIRRGWYLPLGAIKNKRSFIGVDNLIEFIIICITHVNAVNQIFLVSDGADLSTTDFVSEIARCSGLPVRLLSTPIFVLLACGKLVQKPVLIETLCNNLQIDITKAKKLLGWSPKISTKEGLKRAIID